MPRQIKQQIENIIDYRKRTRLPKIEQQIAFLKDVLSKVEKLDSVIATVRYQIEQKTGPTTPCYLPTRRWKHVSTSFRPLG